jgi:hypothetical protein
MSTNDPLRAAMRQASFALRTIAPNDPDAQMTVEMIDAALSAAQVEPVSAEQVRALLWEEHPECCGQPVVGAEYMGSVEFICCGNPEPALLNDAQIVASLRAMFPPAPGHTDSTGHIKT